MFTRSWLTPNAIRDPHNPKASRSLCCPQGQSSCRHSSWAAGQALSGLVPLGQFPTSGAKLCIFHRGDLSPGGKQEQILSSAVSPASRSSGAAVPVVWEGWEEGLALLRAGWSPSAAQGVCCWLAMQGETGDPLCSAAVDQMLNQDPTCPALAVRGVTSSKT